MNRRLLKGFIIALAGLFVFMTLLSLFIPSRIRISRGVLIHAQPALAYAQVSELSNWKNWQPVFKKDSAAIRISGDTAYWQTGNRTNTLFVTGRTANTVSATVERRGENAMVNTIRVLPLADSTQVQVEWNAEIRLKWYPWEKLYGIFIEKMSGQGYENALNGLKEYCENH